MNIVVLMAGGSDEFYKNGSQYPKSLIEINGVTMMELVINNIKDLNTNNNNLIFVIRKDDDRHYLGDSIKLLLPHANIVTVESNVSGAAVTSLLAIEYIDEKIPILLLNGDQIININMNNVIKKFNSSDSDAGVLIFPSVHPRWSYVRLDDSNYVIESAEKKPISNYATAGVYYYKKASDYIKCTKKMILKGADTGGNYYICPVFNEMILKQKKISTYAIKASQYHSLMSPSQVNQYGLLTTGGGN